MEKNIVNICVFCSSSDILTEGFYQEGTELAKYMVNQKYTLVNGGSRVGLMGIMLRKVNELGGNSIGVIPKFLYEKNLGCKNIGKLYITEDMRSRKQKLSELADAFIALPGGFGTLEELLEVLTLKQLEIHRKPIVIVNTNNFYNHLLEQFETAYKHNFSKAAYSELYYVTKNANNAIDYIKHYKPTEIESKWYKANLKL